MKVITLQHLSSLEEYSFYVYLHQLQLLISYQEIIKVIPIMLK